MSGSVINVRAWPIWDALFPPLCSVCSGELEKNAILFCASCWANAPTADLRGLPKLPHLDLLAAGFRYAGDDVIRASVHALKYNGMKWIGRDMARHLLSRLPLRFAEENMVWSPVPLHWRRWLARGYNQSAILAHELSAITGHETPQTLLRRRRYTPTQTARTYRERAANVRDAFTMRRDVPIPESVVLMDDVITTGATMNECARALKQAGVKWVGAFAFALTQRN